MSKAAFGSDVVLLHRGRVELSNLKGKQRGKRVIHDSSGEESDSACEELFGDTRAASGVKRTASRGDTDDAASSTEASSEASFAGLSKELARCTGLSRFRSTKSLDSLDECASVVSAPGSSNGKIQKKTKKKQRPSSGLSSASAPELYKSQPMAQEPNGYVSGGDSDCEEPPMVVRTTRGPKMKFTAVTWC
jgi:hypothetical protein